MSNKNEMSVSLVRSYTSKKGNKTFVYAVSGNAETLAKFKDINGDNHREDEKGTPLWFTTRCIGKSGTLIITTNNKIVPDMSEFDQAASLASQYGGNLGEAIALASANKLLGNMGQTPSAQPKVNEPVGKADDLDQV
jgi:hypothetical protein